MYMIQDSVQVSDSLKAVVDSLSASIGSDVGAAVGAKAAIGGGFVLKWIMEASKPLIAKYATLNAWQKAVVVVIYGQVAAFGNAWLMVHHLPSVPGDPALLPTAGAGLALALAAMGWNSLKDAIFHKK